MNVTLLNYTPIDVVVKAIRTCYDSFERSDSRYNEHGGLTTINKYELGLKDEKLIKQIIKSGHTSTIEHASYNFYIEGFARLALQELARHRIASLSVKSTRYTLKELKNEDPFIIEGSYDFKRAYEYLVSSGNEIVDANSIMALDNLRKALKSGIDNDTAKYCLPESYKCNLTFSINARSLRNFLSLRLAEKAHKEIRELAIKMNSCIPEDHFFLFEDL